MSSVRHDGPLPLRTALPGLARCVVTTALLLVRHRVHLPRRLVGTIVRLPDGTSARIYRETTVDRGPEREPCALVVVFRLRGVRGRGHAAFRRESLLNTPLFVGFPGFVSKLWLAHDDRGFYRGLYAWDGSAAAESYARSLWWVLALVSEPGSIDFEVLPGTARDDLLTRTDLVARCGRPDVGGTGPSTPGSSSARPR